MFSPIRRTRRARRAPLAVTAAAAVVVGILAPQLPAAAADAPAGTILPPAQYSLIAADSQEDPWPGPSSLDGTAKAVFDGDYGTQWASRYNGGKPDALPHWLTFDLGAAHTLTGLAYSVKVQDNGPAKDVAVYTTNDAAVAQNGAGDWGTPAGTATFHQPTSNTEVQNVIFGAPVKARYVKFQVNNSINGSANASANELRVYTNDETAPPVDPNPPANGATAVTLTNGALSVDVAKEFPQVISYSLNGKKISGQAAVLDTFTVNGTDRKATTTATKTSGSVETYVSKVAGLDLTITSTITVTAKNTVEFAMTKLEGADAATVDQLAIPNHSLLSVDSGDPASQLARTKIDTNSTTTADQFTAITGSTPLDAKPVGTPYGFVSDSGVSAGIITNATDDSAQDSNTNWNTRLMSQVVDAGNGARRAQLSVGNWTYAPAGATDSRVKVYALPKATVVLAGDANNDGTVNWQDGAIAYRDAAQRPLGADRVPDRVVQHIPFNFASQATNPFMKTLDNVKRISMSTDDLGQWILEKGYASEGHDSGHPDYGGDYNTRAGGLTDFNALIAGGADFNTDVAVHVNATEAYPQAKTFTGRMVQGQAGGWDWLNQSYHIDQRYDLGSGNIIDRFAQLKQEAPKLAGVYIDAYYSSGWLADGLAAQLRDLDLQVATEWAYKFEGSSIWSHWANDKNYGGATNKGINSNIVRFIANGDRDVWNVDPVLGGADVKEFEGWTGQNDWNRFYNNIWTANLPTKFLQHYKVQNWDFGKSATLTDGTANVTVNVAGGKRTIAMNGTVVADGGTYLLPWGDPTAGNNTTTPTDADKMYYYNPAGGAATFTLTDQFAGNTSFTLYKLTDQGRVKVSDVTASGGKVTLNGDAGVPYVLAPNGAKAPHADAQYGKGTLLNDPGFNAGNLNAWNAKGDTKTAVSKSGDNVVTFGAATSSISQKVTGLTPGKRYSLSANIEIAAGERRSTTLSVESAGTVSKNAFDTTPAKNYVAADAKENTYSQRAGVAFTAPSDGTVTIAVGAVAGKATVTVDDLRVMLDTDTPLPTAKNGTVIAHDDFEGNQPGWGPFVKGDAGGTTDPRTSISVLHDPYSQKSWKNTYSPYNSGTLNGLAVDDVLAGEHSLKAHEENGGLVYRTVPATVPFVAGHKYTVSFSYQTNVDGQWSWITGADTVGDGSVTSTDIQAEPIAPALSTATYSKDIVAGCGDTWVGLRKTGGANGADFVLDDFTVTDLGEAPGGAACAQTAAPTTLDVNPGQATEFTTSFTNNEATEVGNVAMTVTGLPDGWKLETAKKNGNVFDTVAPGDTVTTTWLITAPAAAVGQTATLTTTTTYFNDCATKQVSATTKATVSSRSTLPPGSMTATADSQNLTSGDGEGPVGNVLDGDLGTIWHTQYDPSVTNYPHWVVLKLAGASEIDGFGYQERQGGGKNGNVKDYTIQVSSDGTNWTEVAKGSFKDVQTMQVVDFAKTTASYVRFNAVNAINGQPFAAASELRVFGTSSTPLTGYAPASRPGDTACSTGDTPAIDAPAAVTAGTDLTVKLTGFKAGAKVDVTLNSAPLQLGTVTIAADGTGQVTAPVPADFPTGAHTLTAAVGGATLASKAITVTAADVPGGGSGDGGAGGSGNGVVPPGLESPLAHTGSDLAGWLAAALLLLAAGAAGLVLRRRHRRAD